MKINETEPLKNKLNQNLERICLLRWDKECDADKFVNAVEKIEYDVKSAVEYLREKVNKCSFRDRERVFFEDIEIVGMSKIGFNKLLDEAFADVTQSSKNKEGEKK